MKNTHIISGLLSCVSAGFFLFIWLGGLMSDAQGSLVHNSFLALTIFAVINSYFAFKDKKSAKIFSIALIVIAIILLIMGIVSIFVALKEMSSSLPNANLSFIPK